MSIQSLILAARRKAQDKYNTVKSRRAYEQQYPDEARKELAAQQKLQASRQALKEEKRAAFKARIGRIAAAVSGGDSRRRGVFVARPRLDVVAPEPSRLARSPDGDLRSAPRVVGARAGGRQPLLDVS